MTDDRDVSSDPPPLPPLDSMTPEEQSAWAMSIIRERSPEVTRQWLLDRGRMDLLLDGAKKFANAVDPLEREEMRRLIDELDLGPLLAEEWPDELP